ncbi:MAG: alpha/beta fold hydrolase [Actinomycetota bacterium]
MRTYEEFPVYVPLGEERLSAVVCVPADSPRDLGVLLVAGGNMGRTHANRMWVQIARLLAARGVASIRFDYHGMGDSSSLESMHFDIEKPLVGDVRAVADFLQRATGVRHLASVATCYGARTAIAVAAERPDVIHVTALPFPLFRGTRLGTRSRVRERVNRFRLGGALLERPAVLRLRRRLAGNRTLEGGQVSPGLVRDLEVLLGRGTVTFVYGDRTRYLAELREALAVLEPRLDAGQRHRLRVTVIKDMDLHRYATVAEQEIAIEHAVGSIDEAARRVDLRAMST